jgi:dCMP deaminase
MRTGINTTLDSFCDTLISNSIVGGSYEKSGSLRRITLGEKIIDVILEYDVDLDSWLIFIGDPTKPRIVVNANEHIVADISAFIPDPLCMKDIQTLCDMLGVCRNNNWQVKEDTHEEQMESCETSDDKEEVSKLIPKEELMKIIFENIKGILENDLSYHKYPWACPDNSWSLTAYDDSFRYVIYDRQHCVSKSIGCNLNKDHWEIYIEKGSNVNIVAYPDEACWMTDALLFRTPNKDFPKDVLENIITDINAWIKTKTMPNKELSAFSQSLIKDGKRPSKVDYYLAMAEVASTRGTCLRRRFGSVIVKDDRIVSTGYVGAPSGRQNCCDIGYCFREANNIPHGAMYERCRSSHSEMNAIINASKEEMKGATLYLVGVEPDGSYTNSDCCAMCKRVIINSGIEKVVAKQKNGMYNIIPVKEWIEHDDSLDINHKGY